MCTDLFVLGCDGGVFIVAVQVSGRVDVFQAHKVSMSHILDSIIGTGLFFGFLDLPIVVFIFVGICRDLE